MNNKKIYNRILLGTLFTIFLLLPFFVNIFFSLSDDQRYLFISSGAYNGTPCPYLVYEGYIYGTILSTLYKINNNIEWYSVVSWTLYLISFLTIGFSIIKLKINELIKGLFLLTFSFLHFYMCIHPQFTILASELAFASFVLLIQAKNNKKYYATAFVLFFISTQIRTSAALLPYMILFPIFFLSNNYKKAIGSLSCLCIIGIASFATDNIMYNHSDEWKHFNTYNDARGLIADNPQSGKLLSRIENPNQKKEYELLVKYRFFDTNILTEKEIVDYANILKQQRLETIKINIHNYYQMYKSLGGITLIITILWLLFFSFKKKQYGTIFFIISCLIMFFIANITIMSMSFPKERVLITLIAALLLSCLYIANTRKTTYTNTFLCINAIILMFYFGRTNYQTAKNINEPLKQKNEVEGMLNKSKSEKVLMLVPSCLDVEIFSASKSPIAYKTILQGWMYHWPLAPKGYGNFKTLVDGIPMLVNKSAVEQLDIIEDMIRQNYKISVDRHAIAESENYYLIQFTSK